jgi:hypothetical protein
MDRKNKVMLIATISNDEATFEGIPLGKITVTEVKAPIGCLPDEKPHKFTVTAADAGHEVTVFEIDPGGWRVRRAAYTRRPRAREDRRLVAWAPCERAL